MRSTLSIFCLLGMLISLAWAAPYQIQKRSFKVERVANPNFTGRNGPRALLKAYRKYGVRPPQALVDRLRAESEARKAAATGSAKKKGHKNHGGNSTAASSSSSSSSSSGVLVGNTNSTTASANTGTVENTPVNGDVEYLSPITVGGQTMTMDFDTGSSDLWVFNTQLSKKAQAGHTIYDPTASSTFQLLSGATFAISYGDGSAVSGTVGTDTVTIGGATVTRQAVELATAVSASFVSDTESNGLVGLAFSKLNTVQPTQQKTFFDNIQSSLAEPLFTADLRHNATGAYEFGAIDTSKFTGNLNFVPLNTTNGFWQFSSTKFAVGDGAAQTSSATGQAIADTGTTLLLANANIINGYFANVAGAENNQQIGGITIPCDAVLPDLQLDVGGVMATVKGTDIMFEKVQGNTCFSGLQVIDSDLMIFGDIFFKSNFVVFNGGNNTLGFATHA